jgi:hypothetical protein
VLNRKLVKPPKSPIFSQATDSDRNINLKSWRVYSLQFASLEIDAKTIRRDRKSSSRLYWSSNEKGSKEISPTAPAAYALYPRRPNLQTERELAEIAFLHKASALDLVWQNPMETVNDFILDSGERLWRFQLKSVATSYAFGGGHRLPHRQLPQSRQL